MVVGIQYGGNAVVTLRYNANETGNSKEIQGSLKASLAKITNVTGEINATGKFSQKEKISENDINISVEADVNFDGEDVTQIEGAKKFMQNFSSRLSKYNDGKGVQVAFEMVSLEQIFKIFKIEIVEHQIFRALENCIMSDIVRKVYELEKIKEEFVQHICKLEEDKEYFTENEQEYLYDEKTKFEMTISDIHASIAKILKLFHDKDSSATGQFKEQSVQISKLRKDVYKLIEKSDLMVTKSEFIKKAKANKVLYISQKSKFECLKWQNKKLRICLFSEYYYRGYLNLLVKFIHESNSENTENLYILIDTDILDDFLKNEICPNEVPNNPLYSYYNGKYEVLDESAEKEDTNIKNTIIDRGYGKTNDTTTSFLPYDPLDDMKEEHMKDMWHWIWQPTARH
uniref:Uncharacterized protein n=1 Tax=Panagrolaimus davidi TaxID=227884 RepID=A0A914QRT0_9BILA